MNKPTDYRELLSLQEQVAIVTGGGAGIGKAIAETFAAAGAAVVVSDLKAESAALVSNEIKAAGGNAVAVGCNVTEAQDLDRLVETALKTFGKITILVNNAGGGGPKPFDMPMEDFVWAYRLNVFSTFQLCQL